MNIQIDNVQIMCDTWTLTHKPCSDYPRKPEHQLGQNSQDWAMTTPFLLCTHSCSHFQFRTCQWKPDMLPSHLGWPSHRETSSILPTPTLPVSRPAYLWISVWLTPQIQSVWVSSLCLAGMVSINFPIIKQLFSAPLWSPASLSQMAKARVITPQSPRPGPVLHSHHQKILA